MTGFRERVRTAVPGSTEAYERIVHVTKRRSSRKQIAALKASGRPIKLDLGGGHRKGTNGWITVDTARECDLYWDLRDGVPFDDNSVDAVYSSHLFEHLTFDEGQALMAEAKRVLKPGGIFSVVVPNARLYIEGYLGQREIPSEFYGWAPAFNNTTAIDAVNYVAYMAGEHKYLFDQENLLFRLELAGFTDVRSRNFDSTLDMIERDYESIYAEGRKPQASLSTN